MTAAPLLDVRDLTVSFRREGGQRAPAVVAVDLTLFPAQTLAVVGESGSGKSVTALTIMGLLPRESAIIERGRAIFTPRRASAPIDLLALPERERRKLRGAEIAMIFQEPMTSLNPVFTIGEQIIEAIRRHRTISHDDARRAAIDALREVGIDHAESRLRDYPHQFSGGMRQRAMIAMALACNPRLLIADEATTALDATIQRQVLDLLALLARERGMAMLLITHNLALAAERADAVAVMYAGRVVEYASVRDLFDHPIHPYTRGLLECIPRLAERRERLPTIADRLAAAASAILPTGAAVPWWPHATPPRDVLRDPDGTPRSHLVQPRPNHWTRAFLTPVPNAADRNGSASQAPP